MGSIRRSVEKFRSRSSRRSNSVPSNLNSMDQSDDFGLAETDVLTRETLDPTNTQCATPQIMIRSDSGETTAAFSTHRRHVLAHSKTCSSNKIVGNGDFTGRAIYMPCLSFAVYAYVIERGRSGYI